MKYQSKVNSNVTYHTHSVGSWKYLTVRYGKFVLKAYTNGPIRSVRQAISAWEKALPSMPWDGSRRDSEAADAVMSWMHNIVIERK